MRKYEGAKVRKCVRKTKGLTDLGTESFLRTFVPAELRRKYGFEAGGTVIAEERNGELVLRPAAVLEIEIYKDEDIALWDEEDRLDEQTRRLIKEKVGIQE